jgi:hypothetical protein
MLLFQFPPELLLPVRRQFSSSAFSSATCRSNHSRSFFGAGFFFALPSARLLPRFLAARVYAAALIDMNGDLAFETIAGQIRTAGVPTVIQMAKTIPQGSQQAIAYEMPLQRFLEFVTGPMWEDEQVDGSGGNHKQTATVA